MPQTDARTLAARVKKGELDRIYYLYGGDITKVQSLTKLIIRAAVGDSEDIALTRFDGKNMDFSELEDTIQQFPMISDYNCILVNDYNCERPREIMAGRSAEDMNKKLLAALKEIPPQTVVIFNVTGFEMKIKKGAIADKNKKLADFAAKNGTACELAVRSAAELAKDIASRVSARGGLISIDNARELADMCLSDTLMINNEIDKLCAYANGREITRDMLRDLVHQQSGMTVYKLAAAVASMNRREAFEAIDELNIDNNNRGEVLYAVTGSFLDMYRAACARCSGKQSGDMRRDFGYRWEFIVNNAFRDSSRISIERLRSCIAILRDTAVQLNTTSAAPRTVLEQAVTRMLMTGGRQRS